MPIRSARLIASLVTVLLASVLAATPATAQGEGALPLDSLLMAHMHELTLEGTQASGPGYDLMLEAAEGAQFFIIGEEHNLLELNEFTVGLFDELQAREGVEHLVLEQGNVIASWLDSAAQAGGRDSVNALVRRYPHAPTFATDEELSLITHVRQRSRAGGAAVWGVDQELAAMHLLERLAETAGSPEARTELLRLAEAARPHEETRTGDVHYLYSVADPEEYAALTTLLGSLDPAEQQILDALQRTVRIYTGRRNAGGLYASGHEREWSMRARFMEHYGAAVPSSDPPRAIVKMGHWHTLPGFYRSDVLTFGNFLTELAAANGMGTVMVATYVVNSPDAWRNNRGIIGEVAPPAGVSVMDLRPLRAPAHQGRIADLSASWQDLIFQADFLMVFGGGRTGSYSTAYGTN